MSIGTSIEAAITGLFSGVDKAKQTTAELSKHTSKLSEAAESATEDSGSSGAKEEGKGGNIDVTV